MGAVYTAALERGLSVKQGASPMMTSSIRTAQADGRRVAAVSTVRCPFRPGVTVGVSCTGAQQAASARARRAASSSTEEEHDPMKVRKTPFGQHFMANRSIHQDRLRINIGKRWGKKRERRVFVVVCVCRERIGAVGSVAMPTGGGAKNGSIFFGVFPVFVPSLSWQNDQFNV
jgi:hypothetical protein